MIKDNCSNINNRLDLLTIAELIPDNSRVLDLGCGDGTLLHYLRENKNVKGSGIELSQNQILECVKKGVPVVHGNLNDGLYEIKDKMFDFVILTQTLQSVQRPDKLLLEMTRVGKKAIISVINMGFYKSRLQLMFHGKMPVTKTLPHAWYNTPNIHLSTIKDFQNLTKKLNLEIVKRKPLNKTMKIIAELYPNIFSTTCVFILKKN
ncbi:MAG TPA: methionine biosynthesis protein MetW [Victivallales bacterium]|nr:methionine biosynthesis protein MetW [Victivallales bacterium]